MKIIILLCAFTIITALLFPERACAAVDSTGIKLLASRDNEKAESYFEAAVKRNPKDAELQYYFAVSLLRMHKSDEAQDAIDEAIGINDGVSKYHYMRGVILGDKAMKANVISQGFLAPKVKNAFLRAAELDPKNFDAHAGLFEYYVNAPGIMGGSEEKAMEELHIMQGLDPFRGHLTSARYYARRNDELTADIEFKKAIAADPKNIDGYYQYGMFFGRQKKMDKAVGQFKKMVDLDPKNYEAYYQYGRGLFNLDQWDQAIEKFQYALYLEKNDPASIWMLGSSYEKKGLNSKAKETYQWLLQVDPKGRRAEEAQKKVNELQ